MEVVVAIAVLFAIGWVISKSKILSGIVNVIGWAMNILWGVLFIGVGVWALVTGVAEWWMAVLSIVVGIYFLLPTRSPQRRVAEVAAAMPTPARTVAAAVPGVPAGWYDDPECRHACRYWDGTVWTTHVSDEGVASTDSLG